MSKKKQIVKAANASILKYNMIRPKEQIIVAVSGGPDSICLMDVLAGLSKEMDFSLVIAHYEHGLRPREDGYETDLVKEYARSYNLPFETERAMDLNPAAPSLEEKARKLRYDFFERIRLKYNAHKIAMGHNLNDQAETVLMRILRGSGMTGLSGIPPVRDNIFIRPLIEVMREDIIDYLESRNLKYALDSSNLDTRFIRNRIRLELLPQMMEFQPMVIPVLGKLAENLRDENRFFEHNTEKWTDEKLEQLESGDYSIDIHLLKDLPQAFIRRIIRNIVKRRFNSLYGISSEHVQAVIDLIVNTKPNIPVDLPGNLIVRKEYNRLIFSSQSPNPESFAYEIWKNGKIYIKEVDKALVIEETDNKQNVSLANDANTAFLDKDLLPYPLYVRDFRPGDRFTPFGMKGHKKVKDFFIDLKVPPVIRKQTPILLKDDKIVWICGYRIDERFKVTEQTKRILKVTLVG